MNRPRIGWSFHVSAEQRQKLHPVQLLGLSAFRRAGIRLKLDPAQLIKEVIISPEIYGSEAVALRSTLREQFPILRGIEINIPPLLSPDLQPDDSAIEAISWLLDKPFEELDQDYDRDGKAVPFAASAGTARPAKLFPHTSQRQLILQEILPLP